LHGAAVQHHTMAYSYIILQNEGALIPHHVTDRPILNICMLANPHNVDIAPNDRVEPDAGVVADLDIADNLHPFGDVHPFSESGPLSLVLMQHASVPFVLHSVGPPPDEIKPQK